MRQLILSCTLLATLPLSAQTWVEKAHCPAEGRYWAAATGNSTKGYAGTGIRSFFEISSQCADFWEYDPAMDSWRQLPNYPGGVREGMAGFTIGERIFFGFGTPFIQGSNQLFEYLPATDEWVQRASAPLATAYQQGFVIGDHFHIGPLDFEGSFQRYSASTDTWSTITPLPSIYRTGHMAFGVGGHGYIGGGNSSQGSTSEWFRYDPTDGTWVNSGTLWPNTDQSSATVINDVGYVYNVGGENNEVYRYDPALDGWMPVGQYGDIRTPNGSFFTIGNKGYHVFGQQQIGFDNISVNALWEFTPGGSTGTAEAALDNDLYVRQTGDGNAWVHGVAPLASRTTAQVFDADGRLLQQHILPAGALLQLHLSAAELGTGLRLVKLDGAMHRTLRVVLVP